jgi:hypothetical protein
VRAVLADKHIETVDFADLSTGPPIVFVDRDGHSSLSSGRTVDPAAARVCGDGRCGAWFIDAVESDGTNDERGMMGLGLGGLRLGHLSVCLSKG